MPVGVFDSGIGGLTVHHAIKEAIPNQALTYLGDNAHAPYGVRDPEDIYRLTCQNMERLWDVGCDLVVLACNTASAVALRRMQENFLPKGKRVLGVFVPMIEAVTERKWGDNSPPREVDVKQIALFATPATVRSRAFQRELAFRAIGVDIEAQPCSGLVDALEANDLELAEAMVKSHVDALLRRMPQPEAAVLGCTHYPIMKPVFEAALGPKVKVYAQGNIVARSLVDYLERHSEFKSEGGYQYLATGDAAAISLAATRFMGHAINFEAVN